VRFSKARQHLHAGERPLIRTIRTDDFPFASVILPIIAAEYKSILSLVPNPDENGNDRVRLSIILGKGLLWKRFSPAPGQTISHIPCISRMYTYNSINLFIIIYGIYLAR
jgi:hypothetical protein